MTRDEMLERMNREEFDDWYDIYTKICPFGILRDNYHAGMIVRAIYRSANWRPPSIEDSIIRFERKHEGKRKMPKIKGEELALEAMAKTLGIPFTPAPEQSDVSGNPSEGDGRGSPRQEVSEVQAEGGQQHAP